MIAMITIVLLTILYFFMFDVLGTNMGQKLEYDT